MFTVKTACIDLNISAGCLLCLGVYVFAPRFAAKGLPPFGNVNAQKADG